MFSKYFQRLLIVGVVIGSLVGAAAGSATTVTVSPGGPVTGTTGAMQFALRTARRNINCTRFGFTATLHNASGTLPLAISTDLTFVCTGTATVTGGLAVSIACGPATLSVTALTVGGDTPISITGIRCTVTVNGSSACRVMITNAAGTGGGSVTGTFHNATSTLTVNTSGQNLATTGSTCTSILPNDSAVLLSDLTGAALVFTVTPATTISVV